MIKPAVLLSILLCAHIVVAQSTTPGAGTGTTTPTVTGPVISDVTNVSAKSLTGSPKIWGGLGGVIGFCTTTRTNTAGENVPCNSCQEMAAAVAGTLCDAASTDVPVPKTPYCACNENRIYNELPVTILLKDSYSVNPIIIKGNQTTDVSKQNDGTNGTNYVKITWGKICQLINETNSSDCGTVATTKSGPIQIWVDKNNNNKVDSDETTNLIAEIIPGAKDQMNSTAEAGAAEYTAYPGDEKIYIENMSLPKENLRNDSPVKSITLWFSEEGFHKTYYGNANYQTFDLDPDGNISVPRVTGLTNGTTYHFRTSIKDAAGNIGGWATDAYISSVTSNKCKLNIVEPLPGPNGECPLAAQPDQVLGLLTEDVNCFIATAAFGSSLEPKLNTFRKFRQMILLPTEWGRNFVYWYYDVGPQGARWMQDKPQVRAAARAALWPAYGFALLALRWGLPLAVTVYILLPLAMLSLLVLVFRKRIARAKN